MKTIELLRNIAILSSIMFWTHSSFARQNSVNLSCKVVVDEGSTYWSLSGRKTKELSAEAEVNLPISSDGLLNQVVIEDAMISSRFSKRVVFMANAHIDPVTGKRKIFLGMYHAHSTERRNTPTLINVPFSDTYVDHNNQTQNITGFGIPIVSAVSDSGTIGLFTGRFVDGKLKMSCVTDDAETYRSNLNLSEPRQLFSCNISVRNGFRGTSIDEINKEVILGRGEALRTEQERRDDERLGVSDLSAKRRDLQPIIDDEVFKKVSSRVQIMGNLYINKETNQPEFLLGIYEVNRFYDPVEHAGYYTLPEKRLAMNGNPTMYALPLAEVTSSSDYAEVRSAAAIDGYSYKVECKKMNNRMTWLEASL